MPLPVLLAAIESRAVREDLERDLVPAFGGRAHVVVVGPARARRLIDRLGSSRGQLGAILADRKSADLLERVQEDFPEAGRAVVLSGEGETPIADASIVVPYRDAGESLLPTIEDLLAAYKACRPSGDGVKLIGPRWSPETHELKHLLARQGIAYEWEDDDRGPIVELPDGKRLERPDPQAVAEAVGLRIRPERPYYDLAIVGAGPAGLAAAVYGASEGLSTVVFERYAPGGQAGSSARIENYLGFPDGISGEDLARRAMSQAAKFGVEIVSPASAKRLEVDDGYRIVHLEDGNSVRCRAVVVATGVDYRRLDVPGEDRLFGRGVYYGSSTNEAVLCRDEEVAVVGGANSAGQAALHLARYAKRVTILLRGSGLREGMSDYLVDRIEASKNIEVRPQSEVEEVCGEDRIDAIRVRSPRGTETLPSDGLFLFIGAEPHTEWLADTLARDEHGYLLTGNAVVAHADIRCRWRQRRPPLMLETCIPGVFAAGDVRSGSLNRVAAAVGQGGVAVSMVHEYLRQIGA